MYDIKNISLIHCVKGDALQLHAICIIHVSMTNNCYMKYSSKPGNSAIHVRS